MRQRRDRREVRIFLRKLGLENGLKSYFEKTRPITVLTFRNTTLVWWRALVAAGAVGGQRMRVGRALSLKALQNGSFASSPAPAHLAPFVHACPAIPRTRFPRSWATSEFRIFFGWLWQEEFLHKQFKHLRKRLFWWSTWTCWWILSWSLTPL